MPQYAVQTRSADYMDHHADQSDQDTYQDPSSFQGFDHSFRFDPNAFIHPPQQQSPPHSQHRVSIPNTIHPESSAGVSNGDYDNNDQGQGRSSSEEKEILTPVQSKRKAQNRAA